jgi:hypothetical protein
MMVLAALSLLLTTQSYNPADWADFKKLPTEHQIVVLDAPFHVRSVKGIVLLKNSPEQPLKNVLVEIQGPGTIKKIRRATTNEKGEFKIPHAPWGNYKFKTTLDGYKSVVGTINVSKDANPNTPITIGLWVGN